MELAICCEDDATTHGGIVIKVTGSMNINGRRNARLGDRVTCPQHGDNQITEAGSFFDAGVPVVLHQCKTACGSTVIATGKMTIRE